MIDRDAELVLRSPALHVEGDRHAERRALPLAAERGEDVELIAVRVLILHRDVHVGARRRHEQQPAPLACEACVALPRRRTPTTSAAAPTSATAPPAAPTPSADARG